MFQDGQIDLFLRRRVCARCYGDLAKRPADNRMWQAYCPRCGDAWHGATISSKTAGRRGQAAIAELWEVKRNLPDLFPKSTNHRPSAEIVNEFYGG
jgi:hypothetical protein